MGTVEARVGYRERWRRYATVGVAVSAVLLLAVIISGCSGTPQQGDTSKTNVVVSSLPGEYSTSTSILDASGSPSGVTTSTSASLTTTTTEDPLPPAPDFGGTTISGESVSLASYSGKSLVLVFWGST